MAERLGEFGEPGVGADVRHHERAVAGRDRMGAHSISRSAAIRAAAPLAGGLEHLGCAPYRSSGPQIDEVEFLLDPDPSLSIGHRSHGRGTVRGPHPRRGAPGVSA
ncbi:hypothetical protein GCM10009831_34950 [Dietzia cercidiphylli]|uniref:Uncharacterized protein n=1 Tax=Dietzia cercidiphylli TaxID=498199 RepID=A0ABN2JB95_9ACTN